jgi:succinyl-CoA synthetase beta subunit
VIVSEDIGKKYLKDYGISVPFGGAAATAPEARVLAESISGPVVVKALIPTGGKGKAGGVLMCTSPAEVEAYSNSLLGKRLLGYLVEKVLVEEAFTPVRELYAGVVTNTTTAQVELLLSFSGGIDVENTASQNASLYTLSVEAGDLLPVHRVRRWLNQTPSESSLDRLAWTLATLYRMGADFDTTLLEVNPLAMTDQGDFIALDCKMEVDDNALARHPELNAIHISRLDEKEKIARDLKLSYVELDGDLGVLTSGAGLGMMTIDQLQSCGLSAANFLDTGGGINENQVCGALSLIFDHPGLVGVIVNLYGGINRMLEAARGISRALELVPNHCPVVVKIIGNQQEEAWALLETLPNVHVVRVVQTEAAVEKLVELVR